MPYLEISNSPFSCPEAPAYQDKTPSQILKASLERGLENGLTPKDALGLIKNFPPECRESATKKLLRRLIHKKDPVEKTLNQVVDLIDSSTADEKIFLADYIFFSVLGNPSSQPNASLFLNKFFEEKIIIIEKMELIAHSLRDPPDYTDQILNSKLIAIQSQEPTFQFYDHVDTIEKIPHCIEQKFNSLKK